MFLCFRFRGPFIVASPFGGPPVFLPSPLGSPIVGSRDKEQM